jgi:hypothetical protein
MAITLLPPTAHKLPYRAGLYSPGLSDAQLKAEALHILRVNNIRQDKDQKRNLVVLKERLDRANTRTEIISAIMEAGITVY